jgi:NADPH2:quinone reductase
MKAAVIAARGGLEIKDMPMPEPGPEAVLVRVHAAALNRADAIMAANHPGGASPFAGKVGGIEWAGEVVSTGAAVSGFKPGDRVMCTGGGGFAEYAVTDVGRVFPISSPDISYADAAALPNALITMHDAVVTNGRIASGDNVLIQGASSGVGLMAQKIAKFKGARLVIGSSTNADRRARLAGHGADLVIDSSSPDWVAQVLEATGGKGVDLIIDQVSGSVANQNMKAAAIKARIVNVGRLGGDRGEFDFDLHALKRISYIGVTFRTRTVEEVREIGARVLQDDIWAQISAGRLRMPVDRVFPLAEAQAAVAHMSANAHFGKIVLSVA